jgi:hypothetical protein
MNNSKKGDLVTATATTGNQARTSGTLTGIVDMMNIGFRNGVADWIHNGVCKVGTFIGLHPWLYATGTQHKHCQEKN